MKVSVPGVTGEDRGVSEVVGYVLLLGIVILTVSTTLVLGSAALSEYDQQAKMQSAENAVREVDARLSDLSRRGVDGATELTVPSDDDGASSIDSESTASVAVNPDTHTPPPVCEVRTDLGAIRYTDDSGQSVAYEGGGVWRKQGDSSVMVSPPDISLDDGRLSLSLVNVSGQLSNGKATAVKNVTATRKQQKEFASVLGNWDCWNTDEWNDVVLTIDDTEYDDAWERYARDHIRGNVSVYDDDDDSVRIVFHIFAEDPTRDPLPADEDKDGDGVDNGDDNCPVTHNPKVDTNGDGTPDTQPDNDGDGVGDACDPDDDNDGVDDDEDNDPTTENPAQNDNDGDGTDDALDGDDDEDDVADEDDRCPFVAGTGEYGCPSFSVDEDRNGIVVNQTSAELTLLATHVGETNVRERAAGERKPLDVAFVLDSSGSMGSRTYSDRADYNGDFDVSEGVSLTIPYEYLEDGTRELNRGSVVMRYSEEDDGGSGPDGRTFEGRMVASETDDYTVPDDEDWYFKEATFCSFFGCFYSVSDDDKATVTGEATIRLDRGDYYTVSTPGNDPSELRVTATRDFIDDLNGSLGDRVAVVDFDSNAYTMVGMTDQLEDARDDVDSNANGGTAINSGIEQAIGEYSGSNKRVMVVLTDGQNSNSNDNYWTREAAKEAAREDITIYTIGLGNDVSDGLLQDVATETGGKYYHVRDASELSDTFEKIAGNVKEEQYNVIDNKPVVAEINVGGTTHVFNDGDDVNDHTITLDDTKDVDSITPGSLLTLTTRVYECQPGSMVDTGDRDIHPSTGEGYNNTVCERGDEESVVTNESNRLTIYQDGDAVPTASMEWWQEDLDTVLSPYTDGNHFDLSKHQAIVLVRTGGTGATNNYALFLFEAVDQPQPEYVPDGDSDNDGVPDTDDDGNPVDLCPFVDDSTNADSDGDGVGDACDPTPNGNNAGQSDQSERPPIDSDVSNVRVR